MNSNSDSNKGYDATGRPVALRSYSFKQIYFLRFDLVILKTVPSHQRL